MNSTVTSKSALLAQLDHDIAGAQARVETEQAWLRSLNSMRRTIVKGTIRRDPTTPRPDNNTRTSLLKTILANADRPLTIPDIMQELHKLGRDDDRRLVTSTMGYLHRTNVAKHDDSGAWVIVTANVIPIAA